MSHQSYSNYLKTEHWQQTRLKMLRIAEYKCSICAGNDRLQVHHARYKVAGESIRFNETESDLVVLCRACHELFHHFRKGGGNLDSASCQRVATLLSQGMCKEDAFFRGLNKHRFESVMQRLRDGHPLPSPLKAQQLSRQGERRMYREEQWRKVEQGNPDLARRALRVQYPDHLQKQSEKRRSARFSAAVNTPSPSALERKAGGKNESSELWRTAYDIPLNYYLQRDA